MKNLSISDFISQSRDGIIIDVRTPSEYEKGHIVGALNMPLFTNEERAVVGTIYKREGRDKAVERGLDLVGAHLSHFVRDARRMAKTYGEDKTFFLYCWRGGLRSNSMGWLLSTAGFKVEVLGGGYKNYRRSFLSKLNVDHWTLKIVGGPTGCGKTDVLQAMREKGEQVLDLEYIARHRGSAFGAYGYDDPQPTSEHFANEVYAELLKMDPSRCIWCEGESMSIGHIFMPQELYNLIQRSEFVYFSIPRSARLDHIIRDYGECPRELLIQSFTNITKRLGFDNAKRAIEYVEAGNIRDAADIALTYYDKSYNHSITARCGEIVARIEMESDDPNINAQKIIDTIR